MDEPSPLSQPHDKLVQATFHKIENARSFFEHHLPQALLSHVRWETLEMIHASFVDASFSSLESDLLFSVNLAEDPLLLYILFEHQSTEDPRIAFRLLGYAVSIWKRFVADNPDTNRLPALFPLVLAQGKRLWKILPDIQSLVRIPPELEELLRPLQPSMRFHLMELMRMPFESFTGTPETILMLRLLKASPLGDWLSSWIWDENLLVQLSADALEMWARYIYNADVDADLFLERLQSLKTPSMKTQTTTLAERLVEKGRQQGWQEGRQEGVILAARAALIQALEIKYGVLPSGLIETLEQIHESPRLRLLLGRAVLSHTLEDFVSQL